MIKFGSIRQILDKWTADCIGCELKDREFVEEDADGNIYPYESCSPDCSTYYAKKIKEDVMKLLDEEEVKTGGVHNIPCQLHFKGMIAELPEIADIGDLWYLQGADNIKSGNYYWFDNKWNYLPVGDFLK